MYLSRKFTSGKIKTNVPLGYGKVEIRSAMPKGVLLWVDLALWPNNRKETLTTIKITLFDQLRTFNIGVFYRKNPNRTSKIKNTSKNFNSDNNLNEFNVYSVEWNEKTIIWKFNTKEIFSAKLAEIYPELNQMHIYISQGVGGKRFDTKYVSVNDITRWDCPTLLVDYVRYYRWVNESIAEEPVINVDNPSKDGICSALHKNLDDIPKTESNPSFSLIFITVLSISLIIFLILFLCFYSK